MIATVLEKAWVNTKVVVERDGDTTVVRLLNAKRGLTCEYVTGGLFRSVRHLSPRELSEMTNLCKWVANKVSSGKVKSKPSVAVVAETVIERHYTEQVVYDND